MRTHFDEHRQNLGACLSINGVTDGRSYGQQRRTAAPFLPLLGSIARDSFLNATVVSLSSGFWEVESWERIERSTEERVERTNQTPT